MPWSISLKLLIIFAALTPSRVWACAVCGFGDDPTRSWYLISTMFLSIVPLAAMGGIIYFLVRRSRHNE